MNCLRRAVASLGGHIVVFQVFWGLPMALFFLHQSYTQGALTLGWALWTILVTAAGGVAVGTLMWYVVTRPRLRERSNNRWRGP
jgi:hypothetical protein